MSSNEEFDGSGKSMHYHNSGGMTAADTEEGSDDNMISLHYKIGKHKDALQWFLL